jgi:hypothetical protein
MGVMLDGLPAALREAGRDVAVGIGPRAARMVLKGDLVELVVELPA